jgi:hypothetical protein
MLKLCQPYEDYTIPHGKSLSGHFPAGISYEYKTPLIYFDKKLNGDNYRKKISNEIKPSLDNEYGWSEQTGSLCTNFVKRSECTNKKIRRIFDLEKNLIQSLDSRAKYPHEISILFFC